MFDSLQAFLRMRKEAKLRRLKKFRQKLSQERIDLKARAIKARDEYEALANELKDPAASSYVIMPESVIVKNDVKR